MLDAKAFATHNQKEKNSNNRKTM